MAYNCYNQLPDDLANLDLSSHQESINLNSDEFAYLLHNLNEIEDENNSLFTYTETMYGEPINSGYSSSLANTDDPCSSNYLTPDNGHGCASRSSNGSPFHDTYYGETLYQDDYNSSSSSSASPYPPREEEYGSYNTGLGASPYSNHLTAEDNYPTVSSPYSPQCESNYQRSSYSRSPCPPLEDSTSSVYEPASPYGAVGFNPNSPSSSQSSTKPKQKRDRKNKEFYAGLTKEQKKEREKEKCKIRVQRYRERERKRANEVAEDFQRELQKNENLRNHYKQLVTLKKTLSKENFNKLAKQILSRNKQNGNDHS